ncbi:hypothetical protein phiKo_02 [Thermus phage phiKo]|nr:hypothetical protein phiKo_02 [Thermus phage phiKo]
MIRIHYVPQVGLPGKRLVYSWSGRVLTVRLEPDGVEDVYDLSVLGPGDEVVGVETETLPFTPILSARLEIDGDLHVTLLHWYEGGEEPELAEEVLDG